MKSYHIFDIDGKYLVMEVLQYKEHYFPKPLKSFQSLDLAEKYVKLFEDGIAANQSGPALSGADDSATKGNVKGFAFVMKLLKRKKPNTV
jgi:hypothetical protein